MSDAEDRTLPATPARRAEAIERGLQPTVSGPASLLSVAVLIALMTTSLPHMAHDAGSLLEACLSPTPFVSSPRGTIDPPSRLDGFAAAMRLAALTLGIVAAAAAAAIAVHLLVDRPGFRPARLAPDLRRVAPLTGLGRLLRGATARTIVSVASAGGCIAVSFAMLENPLTLVNTPAPPTATVALRAGVRMTSVVLAACLLVAVVRFAWSRWRFERGIRMTPREFEEERRRLEPAAAIDWRRRRAASRRRGRPDLLETVAAPSSRGAARTETAVQEAAAAGS